MEFVQVQLFFGNLDSEFVYIGFFLFKGGGYT
jgi:hypothetical protein